MKNHTFYWSSCKSHMDNQSKTPRPWKAKIFVIPVGIVDLTIIQAGHTDLRRSLACLPQFPAQKIHQLRLGLFQNIPTDFMFLILPSSYLSSNQLSSFFPLTALFKTSVDLHPLHKESDSLALTKGYLHCVSTSWCQPDFHFYHTGIEKLTCLHCEPLLTCCSVRLLVFCYPCYIPGIAKLQNFKICFKFYLQGPLSRPGFPNFFTRIS